MTTNKDTALLIDQVLYYIDRLIEEQEGALDLLNSTRRGYYLKERSREKEQRRLLGNIEISRVNRAKFQKLLIEIAAKADDPVSTAAKKSRKPRRVRQNAPKSAQSVDRSEDKDG